ncbi:MAG: hypothetical protein R3C10_00785 [Pirellulales bacterium]
MIAGLLIALHLIPRTLVARTLIRLPHETRKPIVGVTHGVHRFDALRLEPRRIESGQAPSQRNQSRRATSEDGTLADWIGADWAAAGGDI